MLIDHSKSEWVSETSQFFREVLEKPRGCTSFTSLASAQLKRNSVRSRGSVQVRRDGRLSTISLELTAERTLCCVVSLSVSDGLCRQYRTLPSHHFSHCCCAIRVPFNVRLPPYLDQPHIQQKPISAPVFTQSSERLFCVSYCAEDVIQEMFLYIFNLFLLHLPIISYVHPFYSTISMSREQFFTILNGNSAHSLLVPISGFTLFTVVLASFLYGISLSLNRYLAIARIALFRRVSSMYIPHRNTVIRSMSGTPK